MAWAIPCMAEKYYATNRRDVAVVTFFDQGKEHAVKLIILAWTSVGMALHMQHRR